MVEVEWGEGQGGEESWRQRKEGELNPNEKCLPCRAESDVRRWRR